MSPALVFLAFTAFGLWGLAPSVSFGDSGEFIASAATLAIPHAPGYPAYCLVARLIAELVPWGSWAYRVNLASALCGAGALALLHDAAQRAGLGRLGAAAGAIFLGLSPLWLHTSLQAEVFALNGLMAAGCVWTVCAFRGRLLAPRPMALLGLILGLGGGNHHTLILIVPALLAEAWRRETTTNLRRITTAGAWLVGFGLVGLCVYAYLPVRSRQFPPLDWGHPVDWKRFVHVLLRRDYGSFALTVEGAGGGRWAALWPQAQRWLEGVVAGFGWTGAGLTAIGLAAWMRRTEEARPGWLFPVVLALVAGPGFLLMGNPPFDPQTSYALERFHLLSWIGVALLIGKGAQAVDGLWRPGGRLLLLAPLLSAAASRPLYAQRWDLAAYDYGKNVLRSLPPSSLIYMDGGDDTFYTLAYLQFAEGLRRDVEPHDRGGLVFPNPYGPDFRSLPREEKEARRISVEAAAAAAGKLFYSTLADSILPGWPLDFWGVLRRARPPGQGAPPRGQGPPAAQPAAPGLWEAYPVRLELEKAAAHYRYRSLVPLYWVLRAGHEAAGGDFARSLRRLRLAAAVGPDVRWVPDALASRAEWAGYLASRRGDWESAGEAFAFAREHAPGRAEVWLNLGVTLEKRGRWREAEAAYREGLAKGEASPTAKPETVFQALYNLGSLYWAMESWEPAARMLGAAAELRPGDPAVRALAEKARRKAGARGQGSGVSP